MIVLLVARLFVFLFGSSCGARRLWCASRVRRGGAAIVVVVARRVPCVVLCVVRFYERSVDALASGADEGRGGLRYSSGSRLAGCDPRVSEWGDPAPVVGRHPRLNVIGRGG